MSSEFDTDGSPRQLEEHLACKKAATAFYTDFPWRPDLTWSNSWKYIGYRTQKTEISSNISIT